MTREVALAIFLCLNILIFSSVEAQTRGLCREHPLSNGSALCQEYLKLTNEGRLRYCKGLESTWSCLKRCGNTNERNSILKCYCDAKCSSLGDCCIDYSLWCNNSHQHTPTLTCRATTTDASQGHVVQMGCPASWYDEVTKHLCLASDISEPLTRIPVYDYKENISFNNVYCALCNNVSNFRYWQIKFVFRVSSKKEKAKNKSLTSLLDTYDDWSTEPASSDLKELCIPGIKKMPATTFDQSNSTKTLWAFCTAYSMKVTSGKSIKYKNPHCGLLISNDTPTFYCHQTGINRVPIALIFSFKPKGTQVPPRDQDLRVQEYSCQPREVYDPFENRCRTIIISSTTIRLFNKSDTLINNSSCTRVSYNSSEYYSYPNGSILILSRQKIYTNKSYTRKGDNILLCTNYTTNYTRSVNNSVVNPQTNSVATILEQVCSSISITASLCLLLTRVLFRELRTLNGKNIMSLAFSLVVFHVVFLISNQTESPTVCDVITGLRHYTLLAMFAWMSVIAYDVSRTFTAAGLTSNEIDHDQEQRRFRLFSLYAWGIPLVIVTVCVIMNVAKAADIGYGSGDQEQYGDLSPTIRNYCIIILIYYIILNTAGFEDESGNCYLSPTGRIYCTAIPIGVVLLFDFVALIRTMIAIRRVQQGIRGVPVYNPYPSMTVLCLKLTSVMGLTWLIGFAYAIVNNPYVEYVHTVLNSLQGFFVFICFGCNKQVLSLFKNKFGRRNKVSHPGQEHCELWRCPKPRNRFLNEN